MNDYLAKYGKNAVQKFQQGGGMAPAEGGAPAEGAAPAGGEDPQALLAEYAQTRDPQLAVKIADLLVEMMAQQGGGMAPPPEGGAPAAANGGQMYKKGGKFVLKAQ